MAISSWQLRRGLPKSEGYWDLAEDIPNSYLFVDEATLLQDSLDSKPPSMPDGRIALHEKAVDLFEHPLEWRQIVAAGGPAELEIGSGKGLFLINAATARPETQFVGVELAAKFANRAASRIFKRKLENVRMLRGNAQAFLSDVVPDQSVVRVHVLFPDPWWRNKHKKRRVLNDQALRDIQRVLVAGGEFNFWTDVQDYYEHICAEVMDRTEMSGPHYIPERVASHSMDYTTHFERRARENGQPVYRALFCKP